MLPIMLSLLRPPRDFRPRILVDDILTARNLIRDGAGVGLLPGFMTDRYVTAGRLERLALATGHLAGSLAIMYPSSGQVPRKVAAFRDFLIDRPEGPPILSEGLGHDSALGPSSSRWRVSSATSMSDGPPPHSVTNDRCFLWCVSPGSNSPGSPGRVSISPNSIPSFKPTSI